MIVGYIRVRTGKQHPENQKDDTLIVSEVSRLSRNLTDIMTIMGTYLKKGINITGQYDSDGVSREEKSRLNR